MEKNYLDLLKEKFDKMKDSGEALEEELLHFPDLIKLLCDILDEEYVDKDSRLIIFSALGYLLLPNDLVPEDVYGAYGYMDDLYVSCYVLTQIRQKYPDLIYKFWNYDDAFDKVLEICISRSEKFLEEKNLKDKLLRFTGLAD